MTHFVTFLPKLVFSNLDSIPIKGYLLKMTSPKDPWSESTQAPTELDDVGYE